MLELTTHVVFSAFLIALVGSLVKGLEVDGASALAASLVVGLANAFVRPLLVLAALPLTILTLGPFLLVVNALVLWLVSAVVPGFRVRGFVSGLVTVLVLSLLNLAIALVLGGWEPDPQTDHHIRGPDRWAPLVAGVAVGDEEGVAFFLGREAVVAPDGVHRRSGPIFPLTWAAEDPGTTAATGRDRVRHWPVGRCSSPSTPGPDHGQVSGTPL